MFQGVVREGWPSLLEIVLLSILWFLCMLTLGLAALAPQVVTKGGGLLLGLMLLLAPLACVGPGSIGLFRGIDAIWSGEGAGPWDALRLFFRGFGHRWWRGVGLSALWAVVGLATYAHLVEDRHLIPGVLFLGVDILLLYLVLFALMVNVYLIGILATTELALLPAVRLAAWQAVANPVFTLIALFAPGVIVLLAFSIHALFPVLVGGAMAMFATAALRHAPLRHPDLPPPPDLSGPEEDEVGGA